MFTYIGPIIACISLVAGWPSSGLYNSRDREVRSLLSKHPFKPVPNGGVRSPCPGTNTLANHGFIKRDGRNITRHKLQQGFKEAFNIDFSMTNNGSASAMKLCAELLGLPGHCTSEFSLDMLDTPHQIEHDASLSRNDKKTLLNPDGNNSDFNSTIWNLTLDVFGNATHIGMQLANTARLRRVEQQIQNDPPDWFVESARISLKEAAFYLTIFNDPALGEDKLTNPQARKDWVHYFFANERFPTSLGWKKPADPINGLPNLMSRISAQPTIPALASSNPNPTLTS